MIELASSATSFTSHYPQQHHHQQQQQQAANRQQAMEIPMELDSSSEQQPHSATPTEHEFLQMMYGGQQAAPAPEAGLSSDSAVSSSASGRNSNAFSDFRDYVRGRRQTVTSKYPINRLMGVHASANGPCPRKLSATMVTDRKPSIDSQFIDEDNSDDSDFSANTFSYRRRMSVPEKTLLTANYAILRKSMDRKIDIVGAFQKHNSDAYKNFLQSQTCYDVAPQHGVVIMLDASLTIHKAVTIMCLNHCSGHRAAIVCNAKNRDNGLGIFTISDSLKCLQLAVADENQLGEKNLQYFLDSIQCKKKMTTVTSSASVWDVSKLFRLNKVHRIPVFQTDDFVNTSEILSFICLRGIFIEIVKLLDSKCSLSPNLHRLTISSLKLGTWTNIAWISKEATCADAIAKLLIRKVSCLPMLDGEQRLVGVVTKDSMMDAIGQNEYLEMFELPVESVIQLEDSLRGRIAPPEITIEGAIRMLVAVDGVGLKQCLFVVADNALLGVISFADIMDYLLSNANPQT